MAMTPPSRDGQRIAVIGGGVVGICCALHLQREGHDVVVVDRNEPATGAALASCGFIAAGEIVPLSKPGILRKVPGWLLDPKGPLRLRPGALPGILPWFLRFLSCARPGRTREITVQMASLTERVHGDFASLLKPLDLEHLIRTASVIELYETPEDLEADRWSHELRRELGFEAQVVSRAELRELEPGLSPDFAHGVRMKDWYLISDTYDFVKELTDAFVTRGGTYLRGEVRGLRTQGGRAGGLELDGGGEIAAAAVVVAAGAWSKALLARSGVRVSLEGVAGYQTLLADPGVSLTNAVVFAKGGFAMTPMRSGLGIAGTIEFSGLATAPDYRRARVIVEKAARVLPGLKTGGGIERVGYRPFCPDTLPIIDRLPGVLNVFVATGHGQLGLTLAATTGRIVADLVAGRTPPVDLTPFRVSRF